MKILGRALVSTVGAVLLVWLSVLLTFRFTYGRVQVVGSNPPSYIPSHDPRGDGVLDFIFWPQFLFTRWDIPPPEGTSGGPPRSQLLAIWAFDVPLTAVALFSVLTLSACRRRLRAAAI